MCFSSGSDSQESVCNEEDLGSIPRLYPWRRKWLPTPVFLPGELHGQRSLVGYSPWACEQSDSTERLNAYCASNSATLWTAVFGVTEVSSSNRD